MEWEDVDRKLTEREEMGRCGKGGRTEEGVGEGVK